MRRESVSVVEKMDVPEGRQRGLITVDARIFFPADADQALVAATLDRAMFALSDALAVKRRQLGLIP